MPVSTANSPSTLTKSDVEGIIRDALGNRLPAQPSEATTKAINNRISALVNELVALYNKPRSSTESEAAIDEKITQLVRQIAELSSKPA